MKFLNRKFQNNHLNLCFLCFIALFTIGCSPHISENTSFDIYRNEQQFNNISFLNVKSNIIIKSNNGDGKLYAGFDYSFPDTLKIQFRDPIGRKQALMRFTDEEFMLWLQRENKRYNRTEIPEEFSLFVFQELDLKNIRKLFLGRPLFEVNRKSNRSLSDTIVQKLKENLQATTYLNNDKTIRRVEISQGDDISSIIIYSNWNIYSNIHFPGNIQIIDLESNVELKIKLYQYSPEYFNLSSL